MSFCTGCGSDLGDSTYCSTCAAKDAMDREHERLEGSAGSPPRKGRMLWIAVGAGILLLFGGGVWIAMALGQSPSPTGSPGTISGPAPAGSATPPTSQSTTPEPPKTATGTYEGWMYGSAHDYKFVLRLRDNDGSVRGSMRQDEYTKSGARTYRGGTQDMSGTRKGLRLNITGYNWRGGAPSTWVYDNVRVTLTESFERFRGTYSYGTGGGTLRGTRTSG